jgi:hypothetical protein
MSTDTERAAFEAKYADSSLNLARPGGIYMHYATYMAWDAWQARAAIAQQPAKRDDGMPASADERKLRRMYAARVAMPGTYFDDGEASGAEHGIQIDFMREPVADIAAKVLALEVARYECRQGVTIAQQPARTMLHMDALNVGWENRDRDYATDFHSWAAGIAFAEEMHGITASPREGAAIAQPAEPVAVSREAFARLAETLTILPGETAVEFSKRLAAAIRAAQADAQPVAPFVATLQKALDHPGNLPLFWIWEQAAHISNEFNERVRLKQAVEVVGAVLRATAEWAQEHPQLLPAAPTARQPLPSDLKNPHAIEVPGFGWVAVKAVRAIERAHGITQEGE